MSSHRARGNTSSGFNLQNECYFLDKTVFSAVFFSQRWFTVNPPIRGAKVNDGLPQLDGTSYSALIIKKKKRRLHFWPFLPE